MRDDYRRESELLEILDQADVQPGHSVFFDLTPEEAAERERRRELTLPLLRPLSDKYHSFSEEERLRARVVRLEELMARVRQHCRLAASGSSPERLLEHLKNVYDVADSEVAVVPLTESIEYMEARRLADASGQAAAFDRGRGLRRA